MKPICIFTAGLLFFANTAVAGAEQCNLLLQHGINDITRTKSAAHATAYKYHQNCGLDFSSASDESIKNASISVFGYGSGDAGNNSSQKKEALKKWCETNKSFAESRYDLFQEASALNENALSAWNQCQAISKKGININYLPQGDHSRFVHIEIDSTLDADLTFYGIESRNFDCKVNSINKDGLSSAVTRSIPIKNANIQIDCERSAPKRNEANGIGTIAYDEAYISVNTSASALPIAFKSVIEKYITTPPGAILAFKGEHCPNGWEPYREAMGRTIIGAGQGEGLTLRKNSSTGGSETHKLSISEMPTHSHTFIGTEYNQGAMDMGQPYTQSVALGKSKVGTYTPSGKIGIEGGNQAHENMQPWIAHQYCYKR